MQTFCWFSLFATTNNNTAEENSDAHDLPTDGGVVPPLPQVPAEPEPLPDDRVAPLGQHVVQREEDLDADLALDSLSREISQAFKKGCWRDIG